jgi:hypothetical protein
MREKLNNNPLAQVGLIGVLLLATGFFVMSSMGGGSKEEEAGSAAAPASLAAGAPPALSGGEAPAATAAEAAPASLPAPGSGAGAPPPMPRSVTAAFAADDTVVLLFVRGGGIDDRMVAAGVQRLRSLSGVAVFVVPAHRIAHYAAIAQGVGLNRVPALVVLRPKRLDHGIPTASVQYGFQSPQSMVQAVIDAGYKGPTLDYHP